MGIGNFFTPASVKDALAAAETGRQEAVAAAEKANSRCKDLERKLEKAKAEAAAQTAEAESKVARIADLEAETRRLKDTMARTSGRDSREAQVKMLEGEVARLGAELQKAREGAAAATAQADARTSEVLNAERARREKAIEDVRADLERNAAQVTKEYAERVEGVVQRYHQMRDRLLRAERDRRMAMQVADRNDQAYRMTLQLLDMAEDKIYVLENGHAPGTRKPRLERALGNRAQVAMAREEIEAFAEVEPAEQAGLEAPADAPAEAPADAAMAADLADLASLAEARATKAP